MVCGYAGCGPGEQRQRNAGLVLRNRGDDAWGYIWLALKVEFGTVLLQDSLMPLHVEALPPKLTSKGLLVVPLADFFWTTTSVT